MKRIYLFLCICGLLNASSLYAQFRIEVPYTEVNGKLLIDVKVNGHQGRFVIDTGAPCCVTYSFAQKLNLAGNDTLQVRDSNGNILQTQQTTLDCLEIGNGKFNGIQAIRLEEGNMVESFGIDGVFGYNLMKQGIVKLDSKKRQLVFTDYNKELGIIPSQGVPLLEHPYLTQLVVRFGRNSRDTVMFDSGASSFYSMSTGSYKRISEQTPSQKDVKLLGKGIGSLSLGVAGIEQQTVKHRLKIPTFRMGESVFKEVTSITTDATYSRLGSKMLKYGDIVIDYKSGIFYYLPHESKKTANLYEKEWDVIITVVQGYLTAGVVWDYARLPLRGGERIVEIEGRSYDKVDLRQATTSNLVVMPENQAHIKYVDPTTGSVKEATIKRR